MNIKHIITDLSKVRPIFHSEDDFKFALASLIQEIHPETAIRLERPVETQMVDRNDVANKKKKRTPIDIICYTKLQGKIPIELKYKTKLIKGELNVNGEEYKLTNHGAVDTGRFGLRKDIYRIEQFLKSYTNTSKGYVLMVTNDADYAKDVSTTNSIDSHYSCHENALLPKKDKGWNPDKLFKKGFLEEPNTKMLKLDTKVHWTSKGEYGHKLDLKGNYVINWKEYSVVGGSEFLYCIIEVVKS